MTSLPRLATMFGRLIAFWRHLGMRVKPTLKCRGGAKSSMEPEKDAAADA